VCVETRRSEDNGRCEEKGGAVLLFGPVSVRQDVSGACCRWNLLRGVLG
jgi:hypothetical protein